MDKTIDELYDFVEENFNNTEQFKQFLVEYTEKQTSVNESIFSSIFNDYIENNTISQSGFLLSPSERDSTTIMNEDVIYGESITIPKNTDKLYFQAKSKIDGLCGKCLIKLYQLDCKTEQIQDDLSVWDKWENHIVDSEWIVIPDNLLNTTEFNEYKQEITIRENAIELLPCFCIKNNYDKYSTYSEYINPILDPFTKFYFRNYMGTVDGQTMFLTDRNTYIKKRLQYFESDSIPEIPTTPDFTQLWLCTSKIDGFEKGNLYTPKYTIFGNTIEQSEWELTEYTKEQVQNGVEVIFHDNWINLSTALGELDSIPNPDMKFIISDCIISTNDIAWQPAQGENYWGKNIKISGDKGIYIYNTQDGYNRIINEKQDISKDNNGEILWELTRYGMKTKKMEAESIVLPKCEVLCTEDSIAFYYKDGDE